MEEKILARVRGLLAKAESTEFVDEAEALTAKAAELIAKYGIDRALLASAGKVRDEIGQMRLTIDSPYAMDKCVLLNSIAMALRCHCLRRARKGSPVTMAVIGYESDLERVELLYTSLLLQATRQAANLRPPCGVKLISYRKSWLSGFSLSISERLIAAERRAAADTSGTPEGVSTELVLVDRRTQVDQEFARRYPKTTTTKRRKMGINGYDHGRAAGQRADLGNGRVGGRKTAIGGQPR